MCEIHLTARSLRIMRRITENSSPVQASDESNATTGKRLDSVGITAPRVHCMSQTDVIGNLEPPDKKISALPHLSLRIESVDS